MVSRWPFFDLKVLTAGVSAGFRNDVCWWWRALDSTHVKRVRHSPSGSSARHPRLPDPREKAAPLGCDSACAICTDAFGSRGWGSALGGALLQAHLSQLALREGIN